MGTVIITCMFVSMPTTQFTDIRFLTEECPFKKRRPEVSFDNVAWGGGGGGSSIVRVPGDVPPSRVYFFRTSSLAKGILLGNFSRV